jgi:hypothetical protein
MIGRRASALEVETRGAGTTRSFLVETWVGPPEAANTRVGGRFRPSLCVDRASVCQLEEQRAGGAVRIHQHNGTAFIGGTDSIGEPAYVAARLIT